MLSQLLFECYYNRIDNAAPIESIEDMRYLCYSCRIETETATNEATVCHILAAKDENRLLLLLCGLFVAAVVSNNNVANNNRTCKIQKGGGHVLHLEAELVVRNKFCP